MEKRVHHLFGAKMSLTTTLFTLMAIPNFGRKGLAEKLESALLAPQLKPYVAGEQSAYALIKVGKATYKGRTFLRGQLVRNKPTKVRIFDSEHQDITTTVVPDAAFVSCFLFEPWTEVVIFEERPEISRNQFIEAFSGLLTDNCEIGPFTGRLLPSQEGFFELLKRADRVLEAEFDLTPMNFGDQLEFRTISVLMMEAEVNSLHLKYEGQNGVNTASYLYQEPMTLVIRGQGDSRQKVSIDGVIRVYSSSDELATTKMELADDPATMVEAYAGFLMNIYNYYPTPDGE